MGILDWIFDRKKDNSLEIYETPIKNISLDFEKIAKYLYEKSGIIDLDKRVLVSSRLKQFASENEMYTTDIFLKKIKMDDDFYQDVLNIVTINETYFFREIRELNWLVKYIKNSNNVFKILSIPSSSGEEIYSILMLLQEAGIDINRVEITGFDINSFAIKNAKAGVYESHALHKLDDTLKIKYFTEDENNYFKISPLLKKNTTFKQNNIFELTDEKEKFDIILSRNMFIYFDNEKRLEAINIIINILNDNGIFIKGHADYIQPHPNLENIQFGIYKKII